MILGELFEAAGQHEEAEQRLRQALLYQSQDSCKHPLNPQSVYFTLCCLGASLIKQAKYIEAEVFLHRATEVDSSSYLDSSSTLALRHMVDVYHFQGNEYKALEVAERLAELDPDDKEIRDKITVLMQAV